MSVDDSHTKVLLHCDSDSPFIDESGKTVTSHGSVHADTTIKKFGAASALFNGSTDYLTFVNSANFDFVTGNFTIDFRVYPTSFSGYKGILGTGSGYPYFTEGWTVYTQNDGIVRLSTDGAYTDKVTSANHALTLNQWNHVAIVRKGTGATDLNISINGLFGNAPASGNVTLNSTGAGLVIGRYRLDDNANYFAGNIDEPRISDNARWTADFTPSASAYHPEYFLNAEPGSYSISGFDAKPLADRKMNAEPGSYLLVSPDGKLLVDRKMNAEPGSYLLVSPDGKLFAVRKMNAAPGSYSLTGFDGKLLADRMLNAEPGSYSLSGFGTTFAVIRHYVMNAAAGIYSIRGFDIMYQAIIRIIRGGYKDVEVASDKNFSDSKTITQ